MRKLADPYLKTARAKEHLDDLQERLAVFREEYPVTVSRKDDLENMRHVVGIKIKDIPEKFALVVGDFLYCLRSSLDQLVFALAQTKTDYPKGTQFPIFDNPLDPTNEKRIAGYTRGVPADAVAIIKELQPYTGPNTAAIKGHLLWRLNALCIIDKHRRIPTDKNFTDINFPDFPRKFGHLIHHDHDAGVITVPLFLKDKMRFDPTGAIEVIFGDSHEGIECTFDGLEAIYEFVANSVLPRFLRFF